MQVPGRAAEVGAWSPTTLMAAFVPGCDVAFAAKASAGTISEAAAVAAVMALLAQADRLRGLRTSATMPIATHSPNDLEFHAPFHIYEICVHGASWKAGRLEDGKERKFCPAAGTVVASHPARKLLEGPCLLQLRDFKGQYRLTETGQITTSMLNISSNNHRMKQQEMPVSNSDSNTYLAGY